MDGEPIMSGQDVLDAVLGNEDESANRDPGSEMQWPRGMYSCKAATMCGTAFYHTPSGKEVEITCVAHSQADFDEYGWPDKVDAGPILGYSRKGMEGSFSNDYKLAGYK